MSTLGGNAESAPRTPPLTEREFAEQVEGLARRGQTEELGALLDESHTVYSERGAAAVVRMRGWVLCVLTRMGRLSSSHLVFLLEELDNGRDPYLVAAAARALRSQPSPSADWAPYLGKALSNIRYHDDLVTFERYGGYAIGKSGTTALREVLASITWLGARAQSLAPSLKSLAAQRNGELSSADAEAVDAALRAVDSPPDQHECCSGSLDFLKGLGAFRAWSKETRQRGRLSGVVFEDHLGRRVAYDEVFVGHPSIVVFFYTRCENPEKCSLTVTKLGHLVRALQQRGLGSRIRTAAISYDPAWDSPERLAGYASSRGLTLSEDHRMLRAVEGQETLVSGFGLGVSFVESLVSRHRVELYILDTHGRIAAAFERLQWDQDAVVGQACALLDEATGIRSQLLDQSPVASSMSQNLVPQPTRQRWVSVLTGPGLALATAFFPKCPVCWAAYLSAFGVAGISSIPYSPWMLPVFVVLMLVHLASVRRRAAHQGNHLPLWLSSAGVLSILVFKMALDLPYSGQLGVALSLLGALCTAFMPRQSAAAARPIMAHGESDRGTQDLGSCQ
ncbi:MAG TPA: SCO family protein [Polyangiaceae bacterium]|nr:SCO family protein [Polyangiaceae bacterium]